MLTTITTTTTTTTTTTAAAAGVSQAAILGAIGVVVLILLLIANELLSSYGNESESAEEGEGKIMDGNIKAKFAAMNLRVAIHPLLFSFALIVFVKVMEVM